MDSTDIFPSTFPGTVTRQDALTAVLSSISFGAFTVLAAFAGYFTIRNGLRRTSSIAALAITVALYAVTATYSIAVLVSLFRHTQSSDRETSFIPVQYRIGTAALTITTVLANAVVWSRVWALWRHNKVLYGVSLLLLVLTLVLGALSTAFGSGYMFFENNRALLMWGFYWGSDYGVAVCWFSTFTNGIALILYLVKALKLRSKKPLSVGRDVGRHFVRILESGSLFAIIWLLMVIYQMGPTSGAGNLTTTDGFSFFVNGVLISLLSSLAALIIILGATGKSETVFLDDGVFDEHGVRLSKAETKEK